MPDLWATNQTERRLIAQLHARSIDRNVSVVESLDTGLWMYYRDSYGESHCIPEFEAYRILLDAKRAHLRMLIKTDMAKAKIYARANRLAMPDLRVIR